MPDPGFCFVGVVVVLNNFIESGLIGRLNGHIIQQGCLIFVFKWLGGSFHFLGIIGNAGGRYS
jgi:hypothetical protein